MELWWSELAIAHRVFYAIAIATSVMMVLQLILSLLGFDHDADADFSADVHGGGAGFVSVRTVTGFFTGFGWGGVAALESGLGMVASVAVAVATGGTLMSLVFFLLRGIYGMRYAGNIDYHNAVGQAGSVYLPVPAGMTGAGQVEVNVQGRLCVIRAFTRAPHRIPNRARVRVLEVLDQETVLVEPLDPEPAAAAAGPQEG